MSTTPETDAHQHLPEMAHDHLWSDFARRLERERDEAREIIDTVTDQLVRDQNALRESAAELAAMRAAIGESVGKLRYIVNEADALWDIRDEARAALAKLQPFLPTE